MSEPLAVDSLRIAAGGAVEVHRMKGSHTADLLSNDGEDSALMEMTAGETIRLANLLITHALALVGAP